MCDLEAILFFEFPTSLPAAYLDNKERMKVSLFISGCQRTFPAARRRFRLGAPAEAGPTSAVCTSLGQPASVSLTGTLIFFPLNYY